MPRQARIQSPTGYYHVMMRGNNRENIFVTDKQKSFFLDSLKKQEEDQLIDIAAYCLMDNHVVNDKIKETKNERKKDTTF